MATQQQRKEALRALDESAAVWGAKISVLPAKR